MEAKESTIISIFLFIYLLSIIWIVYSLITAELIEEDEDIIYTTDDIRKIEVVDAEVLNYK